MQTLGRAHLGRTRGLSAAHDLVRKASYCKAFRKIQNGIAATQQNYSFLGDVESGRAGSDGCSVEVTGGWAGLGWGGALRMER